MNTSPPAAVFLLAELPSSAVAWAYQHVGWLLIKGVREDAA